MGKAVTGSYTAVMWSWLAENWGSVASVLGLLLSAWAALAATWARNAANAARRAVELRTLSTSLKSCGDDVASLPLHFDSRNWQLAETVADRTLRELSFIASRWSGHLDSASVSNCTLAEAQLETLQNEVRKFRTRQPRPSELRSLYRAASRVATLLATEVGKSEARIDVVAVQPRRS